MTEEGKINGKKTVCWAETDERRAGRKWGIDEVHGQTEKREESQEQIEKRSQEHQKKRKSSVYRKEAKQERMKNMKLRVYLKEEFKSIRRRRSLIGNGNYFFRGISIETFLT